MNNTHTFQTRPLNSPLSVAVEWAKPHVQRFLLKIAYWLTIWACVHLLFLFLIHSVSAATLTFTPKFPERQIVLPGFSKSKEGYWQAPKEPAYKNERIRAYQDMLKERGITNPDHLKLFVAQLLQENGAISENVDGDGGCSIGIPQRNVCLHGYTAKSFRRKFPAWKDWQTQMAWMADHTAASYKRFDGNAKCTIIFHNRPASALNGCRDTAARYYGKIATRSQSLSLL